MATIDATDLIVGRMATVVAKRALLGEAINIVNCENAVMSGDRDEIFAKYKNKRKRGIPTKGPFLPRRPDMFVKRIIRGMLPYKQYKGDVAFKRIKCYIGLPENLKEKIETIKKANVSKLPNYRYVKVGNICINLGWKR